MRRVDQLSKPLVILIAALFCAAYFASYPLYLRMEYPAMLDRTPAPYYGMMSGCRDYDWLDKRPARSIIFAPVEWLCDAYEPAYVANQWISKQLKVSDVYTQLINSRKTRRLIRNAIRKMINNRAEAEATYY